MVITENMAPPECNSEMKANILKILNFLTYYKGALKTVKANNLLNIKFLNLWEIKIPIKVDKAL